MDGESVTSAVPERVLWMREQAHMSGRAFGMSGKLGIELRQGQSGRQFFRVEVGRDDLERVVMRRAWRRAGAGEVAHALGALAADIFVRRLADLAFGKRGHIGRN